MWGWLPPCSRQGGSLRLARGESARPSGLIICRVGFLAPGNCAGFGYLPFKQGGVGSIPIRGTMPYMSSRIIIWAAEGNDEYEYRVFFRGEDGLMLVECALTEHIYVNLFCDYGTVAVDNWDELPETIYSLWYSGDLPNRPRSSRG